MRQTHYEKVLSSYMELGNQAYSFASSISADDAHSYLRWFLLDIPVVPVLLAFHTLFAALKVHSIIPPNTFWLKSLVVTAAAAFGGSTLAAMFSGRPTPLFTVSSNSMMSYVTLAWYVVHQSALLRKALSLRPVMAVLSFGATAAKVRAMFAFMDDYVREYPRAVAGAIVLGGLSGSGGQLFVSVEQILQNGLDTPSEFSAPGWGFKSAYIAAATYYITVDPEDILYDLGISIVEFDRATARFYIATALCFHAALETLYGTHVNPLFWLDHIFYTVTGLSRGKEAQQPVPERRPKSESAKPGNPDVYSNEVTDSSRPDVMQEGLRKRR